MLPRRGRALCRDQAQGRDDAGLAADGRAGTPDAVGQLGCLCIQLENSTAASPTCRSRSHRADCGRAAGSGTRTPVLIPPRSPRGRAARSAARWRVNAGPLR